MTDTQSAAAVLRGDWKQLDTLSPLMLRSLYKVCCDRFAMSGGTNRSAATLAAEIDRRLS